MTVVLFKYRIRSFTNQALQSNPDTLYGDKVNYKRLLYFKS